MWRARGEGGPGGGCSGARHPCLGAWAACWLHAAGLEAGVYACATAGQQQPRSYVRTHTHTHLVALPLLVHTQLARVALLSLPGASHEGAAHAAAAATRHAAGRRLVAGRRRDAGSSCCGCCVRAAGRSCRCGPAAETSGCCSIYGSTQHAIEPVVAVLARVPFPGSGEPRAGTCRDTPACFRSAT